MHASTLYMYRSVGIIKRVNSHTSTKLNTLPRGLCDCRDTLLRRAGSSNLCHEPTLPPGNFESCRTPHSPASTCSNAYLVLFAKAITFRRIFTSAKEVCAKLCFFVTLILHLSYVGLVNVATLTFFSCHSQFVLPASASFHLHPIVLASTKVHSFLEDVHRVILRNLPLLASIHHFCCSAALLLFLAIRRGRASPYTKSLTPRWWTVSWAGLPLRRRSHHLFATLPFTVQLRLGSFVRTYSLWAATLPGLLRCAIVEVP